MVHPDCMKKIKKVHPFLDLEGESADLWRIVANFMDGHSLVHLGLANRAWGEFILEDNLIWKNVCFKFLGLPLLDHPVFDHDWKEIYSNLCKDRGGDPIFLGGIFVEETSLIAAGQLDISCLNALREQGKGPTGVLFTDVTTGLWVVNQFNINCLVHSGCPKDNIVLEACALEYYMTEDYVDNLSEWKQDHIDDVRGTSVDCGFFVPTRLSDPSSVEVANPNLWGWGNIWEITSKRASYAVGSTQRTPNIQGTWVLVEVHRVDEEVVGLRLMSHLHDHEG